MRHLECIQSPHTRPWPKVVCISGTGWTTIDLRRTSYQLSCLVTQLGWLLHPRLEPKFNFMRIRSFIIAYALVLAIILFADRRPSDTPDNRYSHVIDLT